MFDEDGKLNGKGFAAVAVGSILFTLLMTLYLVEIVNEIFN